MGHKAKGNIEVVHYDRDSAPQDPDCSTSVWVTNGYRGRQHIGFDSHAEVQDLIDALTEVIAGHDEVMTQYKRRMSNG